MLQYLKSINLKSVTESQKLTWIMNQISNFGEQASDVKKRIRQHVTDLPIPPARYEFSAFGPSMVKIGNREILNQEWQSLSARDLLFYTLNSKNGLSKDQIYDFLWPDAEPNDLPLRLKNTLYRLRRVIGKNAILLINDRYHFNRTLDYEYDVESFKSLIAEAESTKNEKKSINLFNHSISLYKGAFLANHGETWIMIERERLHFIYRKSVVNLSELLLRNKKYHEVIPIVRKLIEIDPEYEEGYRLLMRSFAGIGDPKNVISYFNKCVDVLNTNLGISPSLETVDLKKTIN